MQTKIAVKNWKQSLYLEKIKENQKRCLETPLRIETMKYFSIKGLLPSLFNNFPMNNNASKVASSFKKKTLSKMCS